MVKLTMLEEENKSLQAKVFEASRRNDSATQTKNMRLLKHAVTTIGQEVSKRKLQTNIEDYWKAEMAQLEQQQQRVQRDHSALQRHERQLRAKVAEMQDEVASLKTQLWQSQCELEAVLRREADRNDIDKRAISRGASVPAALQVLQEHSEELR